MPQSVTEDGPPRASTAVICSITDSDNMVAVLSTRLRPLLPTAVANSAATASSPTTRMTPANISSRSEKPACCFCVRVWRMPLISFYCPLSLSN